MYKRQSVDYLLGHIAKTPPKSAQPEPSERFVLQSAAENPTLEMENGVRWERLAVLPGLDMEALGAQKAADKAERTATYRKSGVPTPETVTFQATHLAEAARAA